MYAWLAYALRHGYSYMRVIDTTPRTPEGGAAAGADARCAFMWRRFKAVRRAAATCDLLAFVDDDVALVDWATPLTKLLRRWQFAGARDRGPVGGWLDGCRWQGAALPRRCCCFRALPPRAPLPVAGGAEPALVLQALDPDDHWNFVDLPDGTRLRNGNNGGPAAGAAAGREPGGGGARGGAGWASRRAVPARHRSPAQLRPTLDPSLQASWCSVGVNKRSRYWKHSWRAPAPLLAALST